MVLRWLEALTRCAGWYTKVCVCKRLYNKEQPELLNSVAKVVETFSKRASLGTILPFGRFFNNVVATAYQWSPFAAPV